MHITIVCLSTSKALLIKPSTFSVFTEITVKVLISSILLARANTEGTIAVLINFLWYVNNLCKKRFCVLDILLTINIHYCSN